MAVRMSSIQFMYNYKQSLNKTYQNQQKLFDQADGSKLHKGSDDPIGYTHLMRYQFSENENAQYTSNVKTAISWMKNSDNIVTEIAGHMKTFSQKTNQAANGYLSESDSKSIAQEMDALVVQIMSSCNYQMGDRFLFAGQKDLTQPFTVSSAQLERGFAKNLDAKQSEFFMGAGGDINVSLYQMLTMEDERGKTYYLDTHTGYVYSKDFVDEGYKDLIAQGYNTIGEAGVAANAAGDLRMTESAAVSNVEEAGSDTITAIASGTAAESDSLKISLKRIADSADSDSQITAIANELNIESDTVAAAVSAYSDYDYTVFSVSDYFTNQGLLKEGTADGLQVNMANGSTLNLKFSTVLQKVVTYTGDDNYISMVKLNGATDTHSDIVNLTGKDMFGSDIFDDIYSGNERSGTAMLNNMLTVYEKVNSGDASWLSSDGITLSDVAHSTLVISQTTLGARLQLYTSVEDMLDNQSVYITEDITNVSATDVAELATKLMEMTTIYNLALSLGGRVLPQSLADYIS